MNLESVLIEETPEQFLDTLFAISKKVKETAVSIFSGEVVYDAKTIMNNACNTYSSGWESRVAILISRWCWDRVGRARPWSLL
jgi:hypothetical protein